MCRTLVFGESPGGYTATSTIITGLSRTTLANGAANRFWPGCMLHPLRPLTFVRTGAAGGQNWALWPPAGRVA